METAHKNARDSWKNHTSRESYNENESEVLSRHNPNHPSGLVEGFSSSVVRAQLEGERELAKITKVGSSDGSSSWRLAPKKEWIQHKEEKGSLSQVVTVRENVEKLSPHRPGRAAQLAQKAKSHKSWRKVSKVVNIRKSATWGDLMKEKCLHPHFMYVLKLGALPSPGAVERTFAEQIWYYIASFMFISCTLLCATRFFWRKRPAYYSEFTNIGFVLLHMWLPFAHRRASSLLALKVKGFREDGQAVEDIRKRSSLQRILACLVEDYADALLDRSPVYEAEDFREEFRRIRHETKLIAWATAALIFGVSVLVYIGWVHFDFFVGMTGDSSLGSSVSQEYYEHDMTNPTDRVLNYLSGIAFVVIVVPWVSAVLAVYGESEPCQYCWLDGPI